MLVIVFNDSLLRQNTVHLRDAVQRRDRGRDLVELGRLVSQGDVQIRQPLDCDVVSFGVITPYFLDPMLYFWVL
jgi:hypothetical protein